MIPGQGNVALTRALTIAIRIRDESPDDVVGELLTTLPQADVADLIVALAAAIDIDEPSKVLLGRLKAVRAGGATSSRYIRCAYCGDVEVAEHAVDGCCGEAHARLHRESRMRRRTPPSRDPIREDSVTAVLSGDAVVLSSNEIDEVIRRMAADGAKVAAIAKRLSMSARAVTRRQERMREADALKAVAAA